MDGIAVPPDIPDRTSQPLQSRRRSLPPPSSKKRGPSANRVRVQPASPEVISSLISSLSTISAPANDHFDNLTPAIGASRSTPSSPSAYHPNFDQRLLNVRKTRQQSDGFGVDYGAFDQPDSRGFLHPDDAATPPVVRTSKPISGRHSLVAGQIPSPTSLGPLSHFLRGPDRSLSVPQLDRESTGHLSPDQGTSPLPSPTRRSSASTEGRKSWRAHKPLYYMSSKERLRERAAELEQQPLSEVLVQGFQGLGLLGVDDIDTPNTEPLMSDNAFRGDLEAIRPAHLEKRSSSARSSPSLAARSPPLGSHHSSPGGIGAGKFIPARDSSLRKSSKSPGRGRQHRHSGLRDDKPEREDTKPEAKEEVKVESARDSSRLYDDANGVEAVERKISAIAERRRLNQYPAAIVTKHPPVKKESPPPSPLQPVLPPTSCLPQPFDGDNESPGEDEGAPAPAVVQRRTRDSSAQGGARKSVSPKPFRRKPPANTSLDIQRPSMSLNPSRRNSRLQKRPPEPPSPKSAHRRRFSNALGRNSESTTRPTTLLADDRPSSADSVDDAVEAYLRSPRLSQKVANPATGRIISFSEVGDAEGFAVFCCVGMGLTRFITAFYDELASSLKLRLITPDRPGVGESETHADGTGTPLGWPDDVYAICQALKITKFSILAHSAGAIYALATALRMPQHIRGRIHLLAPWIPPSQMSVIGSQQDSPPAGAVPTSQRILRALPTPVLKVANSSFMSATSTSITSSLPKSPRRKKKQIAVARELAGMDDKDKDALSPRDTILLRNPTLASDAPLEKPPPLPNGSTSRPSSPTTTVRPSLSTFARRTTYDTRLTHAIWAASTTNANPAVDLLVCLERRQPIGFRYVDITRGVVIHHGSRDTRVPVENVRWLGKTMRRCEVRVLEGEGHGLMASAAVMGSVLMEVAREWEDWMRIVGSGRGSKEEKGRA
ncbi:MAG: hypothetical protein M1817_006861 [Caeruleum heppii]|nr:MAG: hypothetical protein M1817_006861 [Caeruleum heppii]